MNNLSSAKKLFTLKEASEKLNITVDTLIKWNELNILKPTITVEGAIGYNEDQINQFLSIRQLNQPAVSATNFPTQNPTLARSVPAASPINLTGGFTKEVSTPILTISNSNLKEDSSGYHHAMSIYSKLTNSHLLSVGISFAIVVSLLTFAFMSHEQNNSQTSLLANIDTSRAKNINVPTDTAIPTPGDFRQNAPSNRLTSEGENVLGAQLSTKEPLFSKENEDNSGNENQLGQQEEPVFASILGEGDATGVSYASRGNTNHDNDPVFDETGKIKGEAIDTLSTTLGGIGVLTNVVPKSSGPFNGIVVLTLGILSMLFVFPKSFAFAGRNSGPVSAGFNESIATNPEKLLEVDQKTDGTIVLYFQNREYKVSKPELYSESDQFIERLLDLVKHGVKEIEYVVSNDEAMETNTPLSRLVTRLGFVGLKRDLFFPRTSKDRVHFRRYLTQEDIKDMNLTSSQILADLQTAN